MDGDVHARTQSDAVGLASLPAGDAERDASYAHALECDACARALAEGEALLREFDAAPAPEPPSADVLARVQSLVLSAMDAERAPVTAGADEKRWLAVAPPIGVAFAWVVLLAFARHRAPDRRLWAESALGLALAVAAAAGAVSLRALATGTIVLLSALFVMTAGHGSGLGDGGHCVMLELVAAALPLGAVAYVAVRRRREAAQQGPAYFAATSAAGALAGQAALHLTCPMHDAFAHLVVFHLGAVVLSAVLGVGVERVVRARA